MSAATLGVVGTLVWDRFAGASGAAEAEDWGGIGYALAALSASLGQGWSILPMLKVGGDLFDRASDFLADVPRVDPSAVIRVPEANNRVEIRYETPSSRSERLTGGVPAWTWGELSAPLAMCDALYVNFISGFELDLDTARTLRAHFDGPIYADLHSLFLGKDADGLRIPRPLASAEEWLRCFDAVQVNEDELALLAGDHDPWGHAEAALDSGPKLIAVTLGERGAACVGVDGLDADLEGRPDLPAIWRDLSGRRGPTRAPTRSASGRVSVATDARSGDPTGCGDVWGAATFARLLTGDPIRQAMAEGNRLGGINVDHRGATHLVHRFIETAESRPSGNRRAMEVG